MRKNKLLKIPKYKLLKIFLFVDDNHDLIN